MSRHSNDDAEDLPDLDGDLPNLESNQPEQSSQNTHISDGEAKTDIAGNTSTRISYDCFGFVRNVEEGAIVEEAISYRYVYDAFGQITSSTQVTVSSCSSCPMFDQSEILTCETHHLDNMDAKGQEVAVECRFYDAGHRLRYVVNIENRVTEYRYNSMGLRTQEINYSYPLSTQQLNDLKSKSVKLSLSSTEEVSAGTSSMSTTSVTTTTTSSSSSSTGLQVGLFGQSSNNVQKGASSEDLFDSYHY